MRVPGSLARVVVASLVPLFAAAGVCVHADHVRLEYQGRYLTQSAYHDHLMGVERVGQHHALISSNLDIVLVDLDALPVDGTQNFLARLAGIDVMTTVTRDDRWVFANLRMNGFAVIELDLAAETLTPITTVAEPGVYYEKMTVVGDRLYVAAHGYGIRIFDISDPTDPLPVGQLTAGFADAFSVAVDGTTLYVADGAGGLAVVDATNELSPVIVARENVRTAVGGAQDVMVTGGHVYLACGGAGVAFYPSGDVSRRIVYDTPRTAKHLARVGDYLAVADVGGLQVFEIAPDGSLTLAAAESGERRSAGGDEVTLRLWHGVDSWGTDRIIVADWDAVDVYSLVDPASSIQPDVTVSTNRIRFAPEGGSATVTVFNDGSGPLNLTGITASETTFSVTPASAVLAPGETLELAVAYDGGLPGEALVMIQSDDPDENPLPIQVYGDTEFLDPGEQSIPFTLESWTIDHQTKQYQYGTFDLAALGGRFVYLHIFGVG